MSQCQGTTKAGARCKRDAGDGSDYCGAHAEQAGEGQASSSTRDSGTDLILVGAVALALFAVRRVLRFL